MRELFNRDRVIPAIDIIDGRCVRLNQGDYAQVKEYSGNPIEVAQQFEDMGLTQLHLIDLEGAKASSPKNLNVLNKIASATTLEIEFGGGVKSVESVQRVLNSGACSVIIGSIAVTNRELFQLILDSFGAKKIVLGVDVKGGEVAVGGWLKSHPLNPFSFIEENIANGVERVIFTDISKDGMLQGTAIELYKKLIEQFPTIELTASGGVSKIEELFTLFDMGVARAIVGKAFYEGLIDIDRLKKWIENE